MAFKFTVDVEQCFNCGICMDVCPQNTLDMSRPTGAGSWGEFNRDQAEPYAWMMEVPVQVDKCINCGICSIECPVSCIVIQKVEEQLEYVAKGILIEEPEDENGWVPLTNYTQAAVKKGPKRGPWPKKAFTWKSLVMSKRKNRLELS